MCQINCYSGHSPTNIQVEVEQLEQQPLEQQVLAQEQEPWVDQKQVEEQANIMSNHL